MGSIVTDETAVHPTREALKVEFWRDPRRRALIPLFPLRLLLIVNSFASSVTAKNTVVVHERLSRHHDVQVVETNRRGHATRFAEDAARRGIDVVVAYGGDGTLNEVATGVATTDTALAVLPGGSTNVFARTLGMPNDALQAVDLIVDALDRNDISPIGLGRANGRYFTFHTGLGYDAAVVRRVEQRAALKRYAGHPLFVVAALRTWALDYDKKHPHFSVDFGNGDTVENAYFSIVMNTNPYTYLGSRSFDIVPTTSLSTGLSVVTFTSLAAPHLLRTMASALRGGGVRNYPWLDIRTDVRQVTVSDSRAFPYQLDGDYLGEIQNVDFEFVPNALRLVRSHP
jgi:diacylglycerol kinase family enzyme